MRKIVVSTQNALLSSMLLKAFKERGDIQAERITPPYREDDELKLCIAIKADILFMEVSRVSPFTFESRMRTIRDVRERMSDCKMVLLCDENADPELGEKVVAAKKNGMIDNFFYASVSGDYLAASIDSM